MNTARKRLLILLLVAGTVGAGIAIRQRGRGRVDDRTTLTANGTLEADEVAIGAQRAARLTEYRVAEGVRVTRNQVVAVLDTSELRAQLDQAEGRSRQAEARLAELLGGARPEEIQRAAGQVVQARATVSGSQRTLENARKGRARRTALAQARDAAETQLRVAGAAVQQAEASRTGAEAALKIAEQEHDTSLQLRTARDTAAQLVESSEAGVRVARARFEELSSGARAEDIQAAEARVRQAVAGVEQAGAELASARTERNRTRELVLARAEARQKLDLAETRLETAAARVRQAEQARREAEARLLELRNGARPEQLDAARAVVRQAEATLEGQRKTLANAQQSYELRLGAAASLEAARTQRRAAEAQLAGALSTRSGAEEAVRTARTAYGDALVEKQAVDTARQQYEGSLGLLQSADAQLAQLEKGPRREEIAQARAEVQQARGALQLARTQAEQAVIRAPRDGVLTEHVARVGEVVNPGAVVARLVPLDEVYLTLYVPLTELGRVQLGQRVDVTADTYPGKVYPGKVTWVSDTPEFTPRNVQTRDERVKLVFQVKVSIDNPAGELKPGMPADAALHLQPLPASRPPGSGSPPPTGAPR